MIRAYAFCLEYDGSDFRGWQRQTGLTTLQEAAEAAFSRLADHPVDLICAGRTDAGVHATGQVVHFQTTTDRPEHAWLFGVNSCLPPQLAVRWQHEVPADFNARFSALSRTYRYVIFNHRLRPALLRQRVTWVCQPLDAELMQLAAQALCGEHDFSSFRAASCQSRTPMRRIDELRVHREGDFVYIDIRANAFLQNMVRIIAGALINIGIGKQNPAWLAELLAAKDRRLASMTAPPHGLYLVHVAYPDSYRLPTDCRWPRF